ncbi:MAG: TetR/AcrR family transcriptional regulator [Elusimicrobiota bacterium]
MPKETFLNLTSKKRERVIEAALDEFAERTFSDARVTAIAGKAGIATGSFYQYFKDKKDLFKYIIDRAVDKKLDYINRDVLYNSEKYGFFRLLREIYLSGMRFALENPRLVAIGNRLMNNKDIQNKIWEEQKVRTMDFYRELVDRGLNRGEINTEIGKDLIVRLLTAVNYEIMDIIYRDGKIKPAGLDGDMEIIDKMLIFLKNGIKK